MDSRARKDIFGLRLNPVERRQLDALSTIVGRSRSDLVRELIRVELLRQASKLHQGSADGPEAPVG